MSEVNKHFLRVGDCEYSGGCCYLEELEHATEHDDTTEVWIPEKDNLAALAAKDAEIERLKGVCGYCTKRLEDERTKALATEKETP